MNESSLTRTVQNKTMGYNVNVNFEAIFPENVRIFFVKDKTMRQFVGLIVVKNRYELNITFSYPIIKKRSLSRHATKRNFSLNAPPRSKTCEHHVNVCFYTVWCIE